MTGGDPVVRRRIGDVPFFAVDVPGPLWASLTFRVGRADETAANTGITHLVEHLLMPARVYTEADCNATVDTLCATLWATGEESEVRRFLEDVVARIHALPVERLDLERDILEAEEAAAGWSGVRQALGLRLGPVGAGLGGYGDLGLPRITAEEAQQWTSRRFTSGNAVLTATDPSFELEVALPPGAVVPIPELRPIPYVEYPCAYRHAPPGTVVLSMLGERTYAFTAGFRILERRLRNRLRFELGIVYDLDADYQPVSEHESHAWITADAGLVHEQRWLVETLEILDELVAAGPTPEELEVDVLGRRRDLLDPGSWVPWLGWMAAQHLAGEPYAPRAEHVRQAGEVTSHEVADALRRAHDTLLLVSSDELETPPGFAEYPLSSPARIDGRTHRRAGVRARLGRRSRQDRLTASPEGVMIEYDEGPTQAARYDSVVLCQRAGDARTLLTDDGFFVGVDPELWVDGARVVAEIDAAIPPELVVSPAPDLDARAESVRALAASTFKRTFLVSEELAALPAQLEEGEELVSLAAASRGWRYGLLAITDRRLRFLYGDGSEHSFSVDRAAAEVRRTGKKELELRVDGEWVSLSDVGPKGKTDEIAALLGI